MIARALLVLTLVSGCAAEPRVLDGAAEADASYPIVNHDPAVTYTGRDSCRECHKGNYANYMRTGMGRSFYAVSADNVFEDFTENNEFTDPRTGLNYRMFERDGRFYQRQFMRDQAGREIAVDEYELTYVVGSNNHGRGYITQREGRLFQAPICWDPTKGFWMFCPGFEFNNDHYGREISASCSFCHNGRVELVDGERNLYKEPLTLGIGCERCHGPGSAHNTYQKEFADPWADEGQPDPTIVNPARLPPRERIHVCFQCHLGDPSATERVVRHGRELNDFRPGMPLTEILVPFRYKQQTVSSYSLVSQADRMLLSRCYLESDGKMECLTCHNPHIPVYENPPGSFRDNCMTCHQPEACDGSQEQRSRTEPPDDCIVCHMRRAEPNDRKNSVFTDHWIRRDVRDTPTDRRTSFELEPIFPEALAGYPEGEQAYYWGRAHYLKGLSASPTARRWHWEQAELAFTEAVENQFDVTEAWFFLAKVYLSQGRAEEALAALLRGLASTPDHRDTLFSAAQTSAALGRPEEAADLLDRMLERDAEDPLALAESARLHWTSGRPERAVELYRRAVRREPWNPTLRLNLAMSLATLGRMDEAVNEGLEAVRLNPDAPAIWEFLRNAGREAGRPEIQREARAQLQKLGARRQAASRKK